MPSLHYATSVISAMGRRTLTVSLTFSSTNHAQNPTARNELESSTILRLTLHATLLVVILEDCLHLRLNTVRDLFAY